MSDPKPPREWDADIERGIIRPVGDTLGLPPKAHAELSKNLIRVIEKSAYQKLADEMQACIKSHDEAIDAAREFQRMVAMGLGRNDQIQAELDNLREQFERLKRLHLYVEEENLRFRNAVAELKLP